MSEDNNHGHDGKNDHIVTVVVDGKEFKVKAGKYVVSEFKALLHIEANRELVQIEGKKMKPLADGDEINIHGKEEFITHIRTGSSS